MAMRGWRLVWEFDNRINFGAKLKLTIMDVRFFYNIFHMQQSIRSTSVFDTDEGLNISERQFADGSDCIQILPNAQTQQRRWGQIPKKYHILLKTFAVLFIIIFIARCIGLVSARSDKAIIGMRFQSQPSNTSSAAISNKEVREGLNNITIVDENQEQIILPYKESTLIKFQKIEQPQLRFVSEPPSYWEYVFQKVSVTFLKSSAQNALSFIANLYKVDKQVDFLEYSNLNSKYNLDESIAELPFCIISPSRNLVSHNGFHAFEILLNSLEHQNYTNFQFFLVDDFSNDSSVIKMQQIIGEQYPRIRNRVIIVENQQRIGALGNRDIISRNYCKNQSVIVELDSDDALIGKQVFNVINRLYQRNAQMWFIYSDLVEVRYSQTSIDEGDFSSIENYVYIGGPIDAEVFKKNVYRTEIGKWSTSHLKTYLRKLYLKVPLSYLFQTPKTYHMLATDRFNIYPLIELSGPRHTFFLDEVFYFYRNPYSPTKLCKYQYARMKQMKARSQAVLLPLKSLEDHAVETPNYKVPLKVAEKENEAKMIYQNCSSQLEDGELYKN